MKDATILALDPGTSETAWLEWSLSDQRILRFGFERNIDIIGLLGGIAPRDCTGPAIDPDYVICEGLACYGAAVGAEVFETAYWIGEYRGMCRNQHPFVLVPRLTVKVHHCHTAKAKDANVRQALIDRLGGKGTKANPGPTYGISSHNWSTLAIAVWANDNLAKLGSTNKYT
jgi:hypothetical protein